MYYRSIPSNLNLNDIAALIGFEEAGASQFVECKIAAVKTTDDPVDPENIVKFIELDASIPAPPSVVLHNSDVPTGKTISWTGPMLVNGSMKIVDLIR